MADTSCLTAFYGANWVGPRLPDGQCENTGKKVGENRGKAGKAGKMGANGD